MNKRLDVEMFNYEPDGEVDGYKRSFSTANFGADERSPLSSRQMVQITRMDKGDPYYFLSMGDPKTNFQTATAFGWEKELSGQEVVAHLGLPAHTPISSNGSHIGPLDRAQANTVLNVVQIVAVREHFAAAAAEEAKILGVQLPRSTSELTANAEVAGDKPAEPLFP